MAMTDYEWGGKVNGIQQVGEVVNSMMTAWSVVELGMLAYDVDVDVDLNFGFDFDFNFDLDIQWHPT